jgi:hypothetical protein
MHPKQTQEKTDSFGKQIGYEASLQNPLKLEDAIWVQQI